MNAIAPLLLIFSVTCAPLPLAPAQAPMATSAADADAKLVDVPADRAAIYVMKRQGFYGAAVLWSVYVDGVLRAQLPRKSFVRVVVTPGTHVVVVGDQSGQGRLDLTCEAGSAKFVELTPKARGPRQISDTEGRAALAELSLVRDAAAP